MATDITPDPAVALDAASLAALENTTVTVGAALPAGTNNIGDVDVLTLPALVAGTANIGDVDVLTLPALPAGSNAIGKLAANSGVDIGDVDVTATVLPVGASAGTTTAVNDTASSTTLLASDATRKGFRIWNDSTSSLYLKYGTTASITDCHVRIPPDGYYREDSYYGRVDGIWNADASGAARIVSLA